MWREALSGGMADRHVLIAAGPDGMHCDMAGNLWCGWGRANELLDGVHVFTPDGTWIGLIALPERCANVCFGGLKRNRLFMAASQSLYALYVHLQEVRAVSVPGGDAFEDAAGPGSFVTPLSHVSVRFPSPPHANVRYTRHDGQ